MMSKIGIHYRSSTGNSQDVAEEIAKKMNVSKQNTHDVAKADADYSYFLIYLHPKKIYIKDIIRL